MPVVECEFPAASVVDRGAVEAAWFRDSYRAPLSRPRASIVDLFFAIFGHHPIGMKLVLIVRNALASLCGLEAPTVAEIMNVQPRSDYKVGDKIGAWPIFSLTDDEIVAGRDNRHLNFRLSVLRDTEAGSVAVSTLCTVHNNAGKVYLFCIVPFHRWGVQRLLSRALAAGRL